MAAANRTVDGAEAGPADRAPGQWTLRATILVPPLIWGLELIINYGLASHACYPQREQLTGFYAGWGHAWSVLLIVNLVCLAAVIGMLVLALSCWRRERSADQAPDRHPDVLEPGEDRIRVFAATGVLVSLLFSVAVLANTFSLGLLSKCSFA